MNNSETVVLEITGMTCQGCAAHITETLGKEEGVLDVKVSLESGQAVCTVERGVDPVSLAAAVTAPFSAKVRS